MTKVLGVKLVIFANSDLVPLSCFHPCGFVLRRKNVSINKKNQFPILVSVSVMKKLMGNENEVQSNARGVSRHNFKGNRYGRLLPHQIVGMVTADYTLQTHAASILLKKK